MEKLKSKLKKLMEYLKENQNFVFLFFSSHVFSLSYAMHIANKRLDALENTLHEKHINEMEAFSKVLLEKLAEKDAVVQVAIAETPKTVSDVLYQYPAVADCMGILVILITVLVVGFVPIQGVCTMRYLRALSPGGNTLEPALSKSLDNLSNDFQVPENFESLVDMSKDIATVVEPVAVTSASYFVIFSFTIYLFTLYLDYRSV